MHSLAITDAGALQSRLYESLDTLLDGIESGAVWVGEQAPLVVEELIAWKRAELTIYIAIALVVMVIALSTLGVFVRKVMRGDDDDSMIVYLLASGFLGILALGVFVHNLGSALQVWFAPRVFVIEYITRLLS